MPRMTLLVGFAFLALVITTVAFAAEEAQFAKWSKIELSFRGPDSLGRGEPHPFAFKLDVEFRSSGGRQILSAPSAGDWAARIVAAEAPKEKEMTSTGAIR